MEEKKIQESTGNKSVLTRYSGIAIIGNLYLIRYLYFHIKKSGEFLIKGKGARYKSKQFYGKIIPLSRARFLRMLNGENFRMSSEDVGKICDDFKLDEKYFRQTAPELMEIPEHRLEELDWKAFLLIEYFTEFKEFEKDKLSAQDKEKKEAIQVSKKKAYIFREKKEDWETEGGKGLYKMYSEKKNGTDIYYYVVPQTVKERHDKVVQALEYAANNNWDEYLETDNPVFRVWYYYKYGTGYKEATEAIGKMKSLLKEEITSVDWKRLGKEERIEVYELLKSHCLYLQALIVIENFEGKERNIEEE